MGMRRKTQTFTLGERIQNASWTANSSITARNLRKNDLGGVIFGCTHKTMKECLSNQIFGLPSTHFSYIKNIKPGLPLFLFNYSDRKLHGIFEAASHGEMNINPYGWSADGSERTQYPAQVRIHIRMQCQPLPEKQYKPIIDDNYYSQGHFWFELDHAQTGGLISLFESLPMSGSIVSRFPLTAPKWPSPPIPVFNRDKKLEKENSWPSVSGDDAHPKHLNIETWSQIVSPHNSSNKGNVLGNLDPDARNEDSSPSISELDVSCFDQTNMESGSLCATPCVDEENQMLQPHLDKVELENEEELVYRKLKQLVLDRERVACHPICDEENIVGVPMEYDCEADGTALEYVCAPEAPLCSEERDEEVSIDSSYLQPLIEQLRALRQEVEELKASSVEQLRKMNLLEKKLTESEIQVQQLKARFKELESQLVPSSACVDEPLDQPSETLKESLDEPLDQPSETLKESVDEPQLGANELVFLIGGYDGNSWLSALDCYSPSRDSMKSLKPMSSVRSYASVAALNGDIYVFGGGDGNNLWYDTVESYNPLRNEWTPRPSLIQKKGSLAGAALHSKIFAIGGGDGVECFSDVEMFDPAVGRWIRTQSMLQKRFSSATAELNGVIYVAGGFDGKDYLKSAERFDPREVVSWSRFPNLNTSRACHTLAVLNEKLYALGGYDGTRMVPSVEVFDPRMGSWIVGDEMKESRGYSFAAVIGQSIFVIAGLKEGKMMTNTVEYYKEGGDGWSVADVTGVGKRCFFTGIVL